MSLTYQNQLDSRLAVRTLEVWKNIKASGFPNRSQIDPKAFGADWPNCAMIVLGATIPKSRFTYVGSELGNFLSVPYKRKIFSTLRDEPLVALLSPQIQQVIAEKGPLKFAGSLRNRGREILFRMVLMPLSERRTKIDGILVGMSYRKVSLQKNFSGEGRSAGYRQVEARP